MNHVTFRILEFYSWISLSMMIWRDFRIFKKKTGFKLKYKK